jgi:hypothetical protein
MSSIPRGSTDLESAPLLINEDAPPGPVPATSASAGEQQRKGFLAQLTDPQRELTAVEKLLFVLSFAVRLSPPSGVAPGHREGSQKGASPSLAYGGELRQWPKPRVLILIL